MPIGGLRHLTRRINLQPLLPASELESETIDVAAIGVGDDITGLFGIISPVFRGIGMAQAHRRAEFLAPGVLAQLLMLKERQREQGWPSGRIL